MAGDSREDDLERRLVAALDEAKRWRVRARQLTDELNDSEEATRVYRRLLHRVLVACDRCPTCTARGNDPTD